MDITIGLNDSPRELTIAAEGEQADVVKTFNQAIESGAATVEIVDAKNRHYIIKTAAIAYVGVGDDSQRPVGFISQ